MTPGDTRRQCWLICTVNNHSAGKMDDECTYMHQCYAGDRQSSPLQVQGEFKVPPSLGRNVPYQGVLAFQCMEAAIMP